MKQFNFRRNWDTKIKPILFDDDVQVALNCGMLDWDDDWVFGDAPYKYTANNAPIKGRVPKKHSYKWYCVKRACYALSGFSMALGEKVYPELDWKIVENERHAIAVGYKNNEPYMIFDILLCEKYTAQKSWDYADPNMSDYDYCIKYKEPTGDLIRKLFEDFDAKERAEEIKSQ